jgi:NAD(P)-dependent dehydrogenase (short-subunit alcohol dehydrogenase family)
MSDPGLEGKNAIVTGASRGFGRAIARELLHAGAHVVGVARSELPLGELSREYGGKFDAVVADAADPSLPERLFARAVPQVVVLNAGAMPVIGPIHEQTWETFSTNWHTDVRQAFNFAKAGLLTPLEPGSVVISISSGAALAGSPLSGGYAGAKATMRFISAYAGAGAKARSLEVRFVAILPKLSPATDLGAAGAAAYAERAGMSLTDFLDQSGPVLTAEHMAKTVADVVTDDGYSAAAYLLTATELRPLE